MNKRAQVAKEKLVKESGAHYVIDRQDIPAVMGGANERVASAARGQALAWPNVGITALRSTGELA